MPKIISERCELVKLCDDNCSGPVFLKHTVFYLHETSVLSCVPSDSHVIKV